MAGITTIGYRTSTFTLFDHSFFTRARLDEHPLTVARMTQARAAALRAEKLASLEAARAAQAELAAQIAEIDPAAAGR